jgi:hypothetical protein
LEKCAVKDIDIGRAESLIANQPLPQTNNTEDVRAYLPVKKLRCEGQEGGFEYYLIPAPRGLRPDSYDPARAFLQELVSHFTARLGCGHESFIQIGQVREQEATRLFADHARDWIPGTGLGVWPHRPAPRMLKMEDMENIESASGTGPLLNSVFRVTAHANAKLDAMTTMLGTGCGLQLVSHVESAVLLRDLKEFFLGFIQDRVFRIFPWYVPLIEKAMLAESMGPFTASVLRGMPLYIRESPEDGGILIVSAQPLAEMFAQLGCKQLEREMKPTWTLAE